jgi:hypothetical protein
MTISNERQQHNNDLPHLMKQFIRIPWLFTLLLLITAKKSRINTVVGICNNSGSLQQVINEKLKDFIYFLFFDVTFYV